MDRELTTAELAEQFRLKALAEHLEALAHENWAKAHDIEARIESACAELAGTERMFALDCRRKSDHYTSEYMRLRSGSIRETATAHNPISQVTGD